MFAVIYVLKYIFMFIIVNCDEFELISDAYLIFSGSDDIASCCPGT